MKVARAILQRATAEGIVLWVDGGQLRYKAKQPVSEGLKSRIRERKKEIIDLLIHDGIHEQKNQPTAPLWCNSGCEHFHRLEVPDVGTLMWCCFEEDEKSWRRDRLDTMKECPIEVKQ